MENGLTTLSTSLSSPLVFLYDLSRKQTVFINQSPAVFFKSPVDWSSSFPFHDLVDEINLSSMTAAWKKCLALENGQQYEFSMPVKTGASPLVFQVQAHHWQPGEKDGQSILIFTIHKIPAVISGGIYKEAYTEFIDIAAHDLDAPLRKLMVMVERLTSKYSQEESTEIKNFVQRIQATIGGMRSLIDDLASLSKVNTNEFRPCSCDMNKIVTDVLNELQPVINKKKAVISYKDLPVVQGDHEQYHRLFRVLLDNALLYTKEDIPEITISAQPVSEQEKKELDMTKPVTYYKVEIADNGIGFSPELAGKIFRAFVRLHPKSAFPGNGIGLAIAKRILINHGGIIYVYSAENAGARFIFIVPQTIGQHAQFP